MKYFTKLGLQFILEALVFIAAVTGLIPSQKAPNWRETS